jgi:hypothetical protein
MIQVVEDHEGTRTRKPRAPEILSGALVFIVAGARNHLQADRPLEFRFEIVI